MKKTAVLWALAAGMFATSASPALADRNQTVASPDRSTTVASAGQNAQLQKCYHHRAKIKLAKRSGPGKSYHRTGWVGKNKRVCINKIKKGGSFRQCGGGRDWAHIAGTRSWVAGQCLRWDE
ncbi:hypothetical protein [Streptomyces sp. BRA346]|uniref:hypothetical protein n=1 Tax=Streptomyces sp. BRA346 TaxID=2878199 RepID=UPI00406315B3